MKTIICLFFLVVSVSACSPVSMSRMVEEPNRTNPMTGLAENNPPQHWTQNKEHLVKTIAEGTAKSVELSFYHGPWRSYYPNANVTATYHPTQNGHEIDLTWRSDTIGFAPGSYSIADEANRKKNSREDLAFSAFAGDGLKFLISQLKAAGVPANVGVVARSIGQADGLPVRSMLFYNGEFGSEVVLNSNQTILNDQPASFTIQQGQRIGNPELAALRAYCLMHNLEAHLSNSGVSLPFDRQYKLSTTSKVGAAFRTAQISFIIR